nr:helix-turn-helix transcriptional regulator [Clostridia bacterium]
MLGTRYEEYALLTGDLPFVLNHSLKRTPLTNSAEANWHENTELQLCLSGCGYVLLDGERHEICEGDIVTVNSNVIHYTGTDTSLQYTCLIIDPNFCRRVDLDNTEIKYEPIFRDSELENLFYSLTTAYADTTDPCRTAELNRILLQMLIILRRYHTLSATVPTYRSTEHEMVRAAINYIRNNINEKMTLDDIAHRIYTDKYRLSHSFKAVTGQTVVNYINSYRCRRAAEMIAEGMTVTEAAHSSGFTNMSYFTKTFKKHTGFLPSNCR